MSEETYNMLETEKQLRKEILQNLNVKIMDSATWSIPVHTIEIEFKTVKRTKMDVLMKMILIAFQKAAIESAEELSELLLVELLFIQDFMEIMSRTRLIVKDEKAYRLTDKGLQQLENGIFEEEQEVDSKNKLYSPSHSSFWAGDINIASDETKKIDVYRYANEDKRTVAQKFDEAIVIEALQKDDIEVTEGDAQTIISEVVSTSRLHIDQIPCIEFILYNSEEDSMYARVWNTLREQWDEALENQLNEKERIEWRKRYL